MISTYTPITGLAVSIRRYSRNPFATTTPPKSTMHSQNVAVTNSSNYIHAFVSKYIYINILLYITQLKHRSSL